MHTTKSGNTKAGCNRNKQHIHLKATKYELVTTAVGIDENNKSNNKNDNYMAELFRSS